MASAGNLRDAMAPLGDYLLQGAEVDGYLINLLDESGSNLVCESVGLPGGWKHIEETYYNFKFPLGTADANVVSFEKRRILKIDDQNIADYPGATATRFFRWEIRSLLIFPIYDGEICIGTVMVFSQTADLAPARVETLARELAPLGAVIHNLLNAAWIRRKQRLIENAARERQEFLRFITEVNKIDSLEKICEEIAAEFLRRTPYELVGVSTRRRDQLVLEKLIVGPESYLRLQQPLERFYSEHPFRIDQTDSAVPTAFIQDAPMYFPDSQDIASLPMSAKDREALDLMETARTVFICPIRGKSEPVGVFWLISLSRPVPMSEEEKEFVLMLSSFVGTAMSNSALYEIIGRQKQEIEVLNADLRDKVDQLGELASTDQLTGLHNYGYLQGELERRVSEYARRPDGQLSVVIFDVDHFKRFNDTYGHLAGNEVLRRLARSLQSLARRMDLPCRYGGEEFVVLLPDCGTDGARTFAERVRRDLLANPLWDEDPEHPITISAGCATFYNGENADEFMERADQALYRAKNNGRNRVEVASPTDVGTS